MGAPGRTSPPKDISSTPHHPGTGQFLHRHVTLPGMAFRVGMNWNYPVQYSVNTA